MAKKRSGDAVNIRFAVAQQCGELSNDYVFFRLLRNMFRAVVAFMGDCFIF